MNQKNADIIKLALVSLSLILALYTIFTTSINRLYIGDLGLLTVLPISYWLGLVSIFPIIYLSERSKTLSIISLILSILYLFYIPAHIKNTVWLSNSYYPFGEGMIISQTGHLVISPYKIITSYQDWPIFLYFSSILLLIPGLPTDLILKTFPVLFISFYGMVIFQILNQKFSFYNSILGAIWFVGSFWVRQHYFGPPGFSFLYFMLIILLITKLFLNTDRSIETKNTSTIYMFLVILTYFTLTITHLLTSFFALLFVIALYLVEKYTKKIVTSNIKSLIMIFSLIMISYNTLFVQNILLKIVFREIFIAEPFRIYMESGRIIGTVDMLVNYYSSWLIVVINVIVVLTALYRIYTRRTLDYRNLFFIAFLVLVGGFAVVGRYGSNEAYQRAFMIGLVPFSYFAMNLFKDKPKLIMVLVSALLVLNIPAQYGSDAFRISTTTQFEGSRFYAESVPDNRYVVTRFTLYIRYFEPEKQIRVVSYSEFPFTTSIISSEVEKALSGAEYYVQSDMLDNYYLFYLGENPLDNINHNLYDRVYDNSGYTIFKTGNES